MKAHLTSRTLTVLVLAISFSIVSCAKKQSSADDTYPSDIASQQHSPEVTAQPNGTPPTEGQGSVTVQQFDSTIENSTPSTTTYGPAASLTTLDSSAKAIAMQKRMIAKQGTLNFASKDYQPTLDSITAITLHFGGYVMRENVDARSEDITMANLVVQIPSQHFDSALYCIKHVGAQLVNDVIDIQQVTQKYRAASNITATRRQQLAQLRSTERATKNPSAKADLQLQIASLEQQLNLAQDQKENTVEQVIYSTLTIQIRSDKTQNAWERIERTATIGGMRFLNVFLSIFLFLLGVLPVGLTIGALWYWVNKIYKRKLALVTVPVMPATEIKTASD